jgi:cardiolipin synthase
VKLIVQPGDGVTPLLNSIKGAKKSVQIAIFRFAHRGLEEALVAAVGRGVSVSALIAHMNGSDAAGLRKLEMRLLGAGVKVSRTDTALARYHAKYMIIDQKELFVLAFNYTGQDINHSRSFGLIIRNRELVCEAAKLFEADLMRQAYKPGSASLIVSPLNARKQLSSFIRGTKSDLLVYDPRVSDPGMLRLLRDRAKSGVSVRVIGRVTGNSEGLAVRQFEAMRLHTRSVVRDGKMLFVGSQSLREHELEARRELGVICRDRAAVSGMMKVFEEDWAVAIPARSTDGRALPLTKIAKKVGKAISRELPPVAPVLESVIKRPENLMELQMEEAELEKAVRDAVKAAVKTAIEQVVEQ